MSVAVSACKPAAVLSDVRCLVLQDIVLLHGVLHACHQASLLVCAVDMVSTNTFTAAGCQQLGAGSTQGGPL